MFDGEFILTLIWMLGVMLCAEAVRVKDYGYSIISGFSTIFRCFSFNQNYTTIYIILLNIIVRCNYQVNKNALINMYF